MTTREDFENTIKETPHDTVTRLVFADWLEERGLDDEAAAQRQWVKSHLWMREFVKEHHTYAKYHKPPFEQEARINEEDVQEWYRQFLTFLDLHRAGEGYLSFDIPYDFNSYSEEMWEHFEVLTGKESPQGEFRKSRPPLRCGC